MHRRLALGLAVLGVLGAVPAALAGYGAPFAVQGGPGVLSNDGSVRYLALDGGSQSTVLNAIKTNDGSRTKSTTVNGSFGVPMLTNNGLSGGLSHDGTMLVLQSLGAQSPTKFNLINTEDLSALGSIQLKGLFSYDALSPDGSKLYLVQHSSVADMQHYVVRLYDLSKRALMPGKIADKTQKGWVMQGFPASRTTSVDGRWVYTLYANPGGYPFIHALDTVRGVAHCVGIPWAPGDRNQTGVYNLVLSLRGNAIVVNQKSGQKFLTVNRATWHVTKVTS
ncbi:MAG: hypothetical protein QOF43_1186 [Gaiellaceae bacterium]|nr:hypothetical protein [Gaiellaceae bacterium]